MLWRLVSLCILCTTSFASNDHRSFPPLLNPSPSADTSPYVFLLPSPTPATAPADRISVAPLRRSTAARQVMELLGNLESASFPGLANRVGQLELEDARRLATFLISTLNTATPPSPFQNADPVRWNRGIETLLEHLRNHFQLDSPLPREAWRNYRTTTPPRNESLRDALFALVDRLHSNLLPHALDTRANPRPYEVTRYFDSYFNVYLDLEREQEFLRTAYRENRTGFHTAYDAFRTRAAEKIAALQRFIAEFRETPPAGIPPATFRRWLEQIRPHLERIHAWLDDPFATFPVVNPNAPVLPGPDGRFQTLQDFASRPAAERLSSYTTYLSRLSDAQLRSHFLSLPPEEVITLRNFLNRSESNRLLTLLNRHRPSRSMVEAELESVRQRILHALTSNATADQIRELEQQAARAETLLHASDQLDIPRSEINRRLHHFLPRILSLTTQAEMETALRGLSQAERVDLHRAIQPGTENPFSAIAALIASRYPGDQNAEGRRRLLIRFSNAYENALPWSHVAQRRIQEINRIDPQAGGTARDRALILERQQLEGWIRDMAALNPDRRMVPDAITPNGQRPPQTPPPHLLYPGIRSSIFNALTPADVAHIRTVHESQTADENRRAAFEMTDEIRAATARQREAMIRDLERAYPRFTAAQRRRLAPWLFEPNGRYFRESVAVDANGDPRLVFIPTPELRNLQFRQAAMIGTVLRGNFDEARYEYSRYQPLRIPATPEEAQAWWARYGETDPERILESSGGNQQSSGALQDVTFHDFSMVLPAGAIRNFLSQGFLRHGFVATAERVNSIVATATAEAAFVAALTIGIEAGAETVAHAYGPAAGTTVSLAPLLALIARRPVMAGIRAATRPRAPTAFLPFPEARQAANSALARAQRRFDALADNIATQEEAQNTFRNLFFEEFHGRPAQPGAAGASGFTFLDTPEFAQALSGLRFRNQPLFNLTTHGGNGFGFDHHGPFFQASQVAGREQNTTMQLLQYLERQMAENPGLTRQALVRRLQEQLGTVTTDNLGDGALSIWIRNNLDTVAANPELRNLLRQATHYEDFGLFGTAAEAAATPAQRQANEFMQAVLHGYDNLLREFGVTAGDRITALSAQQQTRILTRAQQHIQRVLDNPQFLRESAASFRNLRGQAMAEVAAANRNFMDELRQTLMRNGQSQATADRFIEDLSRQIFIFSDGAVNSATHGRFASWSAASQAHQLPLQLNIYPCANGRTCFILAVPDGRQFGHSLEVFAQALRNALPEAERAAVGVRGTTLTFSFGGVPLSRDRILEIFMGALRNSPQNSRLPPATALSAIQREAVLEWTAGRWQELNQFLRNGRLSEAARANVGQNAETQLTRLAENLESAVLSQPALTQELVVHRGFRVPTAAAQGETITDLGFVATSLNETVARDFAATGTGTPVVWNIRVPSGMRALRITGTSQAEQLEVLLPRNSSFRVIRSETRGGTVYQDVELVWHDSMLGP